MTLRRDVSGRAKRDIAKQYKWYARHANRDVAEEYYDAFLAAVTLLELQPGLGVAQDFGIKRLAGLRWLVMVRPYDNHLIFYKYDSEVLRVVRVIHGARDLPRRIMQEEPAVYGATAAGMVEAQA